MTLVSTLVSIGAVFCLRGAFGNGQAARRRSRRGCGRPGTGSELRRRARARCWGCAARGAGGQRGGSAGSQQPENKTKSAQRPSCLLAPSLGYTTDPGLAVFPTTRILRVLFPLYFCPLLFYMVDFTDSQSLQLSLSLSGGLHIQRMSGSLQNLAA